MLLADDRCPPEHRRGREGFCPLSLTDWIEAARNARVPHVPAVEIARFERDDLKHHEYEGPHQRRLDAAYALTAEAADDRCMMRWDCCAPGTLKSVMTGPGRDGAIPADIRNGLPLDCRLLDILEDWPRLAVPVLKRPWLSNAVRYRGYPVEYRAFVRDGALEAISSYYIQIPLRRDDDELREVRRLSAALAETIRGPFEWPETVEEKLIAQAVVDGLTPDPDKPSRDGLIRHKADRPTCTMDFIVAADGAGTPRVLFLEGGPPPEFGADPCCFRDRRLEGVKLNARNEPPLPLSITE